MEKQKDPRGRKPIPKKDRKVRVYAMVKSKHSKEAQAKLNEIAAELNSR